MTILATALDPRSEVFRANVAAMRGVGADLRAQPEAIALGGDEASRRRHVGRGKLLPRDRVRTLIDPGSPFLEFSAFAAHGMYDGGGAGAGGGPRAWRAGRPTCGG